MKYFYIKIPSSVLAKNYSVDDDKLQAGDVDFDIEGPKWPSWNEWKGALYAIQDASLFSSQYREERNYLVMKMQHLLRCAKVGSLKEERLVTSYFQKL